MLLENMTMALHAIRSNKMRSFLTMLGIIIGIASVIAIVSVGDSMRSLYADAYKNIGVNRAIVMVSWRGCRAVVRDSQRCRQNVPYDNQ